MHIIERAAAARDAAAARFDQVVEWELASGRTSELAAAGLLGIQSRKGIRAARERAGEHGPLRPVALPAVLYVRGAGQPDRVWAGVEQAAAAWGLVVVRDRTQAWHLSRGGCPVVFLDMSAGRADGVKIARVQARHITPEDDQPYDDAYDAAPVDTDSQRRLPAVGPVTILPHGQHGADLVALAADMLL